jgi:hypothetical protein
MSTEPQREIISKEYERSTYNGISIIRHVNSGYINATKICSDNHKKYKKLTDSARLKTLIELYTKIYKK